jgi:hypothetical protein
MRRRSLDLFHDVAIPLTAAAVMPSASAVPGGGMSRHLQSRYHYELPEETSQSRPRQAPSMRQSPAGFPSGQ